MMSRKAFALLRTFVLAALVPALSLSLVACDPENGEGGGTDTPDVAPEVSVPDGYVNYFIEDLSFSRSSGEVKVAFQINVDWTMKVVGADGASAPWCSVDPASGDAGLHKVMVRVTDNDSYELRSAKIQLMCGTAKVAEIAVTQDYEYAVLLSRSDYSVSYEATTIDVELKSNVDFAYEVLDADWVRESSEVTRGLATHNLVFDVDENDSRSERVAHILFYNSEYAVADTLTLVQEGNPDALAYYAVDLGLSVKWASCNVGAESPEEYGGYYAWGETEEKSYYTSLTYKYYLGDLNGDGNIDDENEYQNIGSCISGTSYDVAHVKWGGSWRMPTLDEIKELCNKCSWLWTEVNGVNGQKVTGPNGNSIFLPAADVRYGTEVINRGSCGFYWSGTLYEVYSNYAYYLNFYSGARGWDYYSRNRGLTVRPVTD